MSIMPTDCSLMVQSKCLTYEAFRGSGLGNQLILEDLRNIWLSDPATSWELDRSAGSPNWTAAHSQPVNLTLFIHLSSCQDLYIVFSLNLTIIALFYCSRYWDWSAGWTRPSHYLEEGCKMLLWRSDKMPAQAHQAQQHNMGLMQLPVLLRDTDMCLL